MNTIQALEAALAAQPDDLTLRNALEDELRETLLWSHADADAHVQFIWRTASAGFDLAEAAALLAATSPVRENLMLLILLAVPIEWTGAAFVFLEPGIRRPQLTDASRHFTVEGRRPLTVMVGAEWVIETNRDLSNPSRIRGKKKKTRRPRGR